MKTCPVCSIEFDPKSDRAVFCSRRCKDSRTRAHLAVPVESPADAKLPVDRVFPDPENVRGDLGDISELADSIRELGVLQALLVRSHPEVEGAAMVVAGHRRLAAAKLAGLDVVPVSWWARADESGNVVAAMVVENTMRDAISPLEEARALARLRDEEGLTQRAIAQKIGRTQAHVSRRLGLLALPEQFQQLVDTGGISLEQAQKLGQIDAEALELVSERLAKGQDITEFVIENAVARAAGRKTIAEWWARVMDAGVEILEERPEHGRFGYPAYLYPENDTHAAKFEELLSTAVAATNEHGYITLYPAKPEPVVRPAVDDEGDDDIDETGHVAAPVPSRPARVLSPIEQFVVEHLPNFTELDGDDITFVTTVIAELVCDGEYLGISYGHFGFVPSEITELSAHAVTLLGCLSYGLDRWDDQTDAATGDPIVVAFAKWLSLAGFEGDGLEDFLESLDTDDDEELTDEESEELVRQFAASKKVNVENEDGTGVIVGLDTPTQDELAAAEGWTPGGVS